MKLTILILVVLCGSAHVLGLDCSDKESLKREQMRCYVNLGLSLDGVDNPSDIQHIIQRDPAYMCKNMNQVKSTMQCGMRLAKQCLVKVGQSTDILPDTDRMMSGIAYLCKEMQNIDMSCLTTQEERLKTCVIEKAISVFSGNTDKSVTYITCKSFEITEQCIRELTGCSAQTRSVYARFTKEYLTPPACGRYTKHIGQNFTTMAPFTVAEVVTVMPSLPHVSCYSQSAIQASQLKCFEREGISVTLPQLGGNSAASKQSLLDSLMANNKDISVLCRDAEKYKRAMGCAMDVGRKCMPDGYKDYLPTASNVRMMITKMCENPDDVNQQCVNGKASALLECGMNKALQSRSRNVKAILCNAFSWNMACQMEVLPPCGCRTTALYATIAKEYLNPPACGPIQYDVPQCSAFSDSFLSNPNSTPSF